MSGTLTSPAVLSVQFTGLVSKGVSRGGNGCVWVHLCVCMCATRRLDSTPTSSSSPDTGNKTKQTTVVWLCVWMCTQEKGQVCCRAADAVTNLPVPPDRSRNKVTELWLDKHRSPASISHPVHFRNTWLSLGSLGPEKGQWGEPSRDIMMAMQWATTSAKRRLREEQMDLTQIVWYDWKKGGKKWQVKSDRGF